MIFLGGQFKSWLKWMGGMLVGIALIIAGITLWFKHHFQVVPAPHISLPANTKEVVTYNENVHRIAITTVAGTTTVYSRNPTVEIHKDGTVKVNANAWGLEFNPILGIGYQDTRRFYLGVNHFYFHQFDIFTAVGFPMDNGHILIEPITGVSWNLWHSCSLNVGINPVNIILREKPEIGIMLSVRL